MGGGEKKKGDKVDGMESTRGEVKKERESGGTVECRGEQRVKEKVASGAEQCQGFFKLLRLLSDETRSSKTKPVERRLANSRRDEKVSCNN